LIFLDFDQLVPRIRHLHLAMSGANFNAGQSWQSRGAMTRKY